MYDIGTAVWAPGNATSARFSPVFLSYAWRIGRPPDPSAPISSVLVTTNDACAGKPVGGTLVSPSLSSAALIAGGVPPFGTCHAISPLFMSYAVMRPYGGFSSGRSSMFGTWPPRPAVYAAFVGSGGSVLTTPATNGRVTDPMYTNPVSGAAAPDCQFAPPPKPGATIVPRFTPGTTSDGGANGPPRRYGPALIASSAFARRSGVKSTR